MEDMMMDGPGHSGATQAELEAIRRAGHWMPWAGLGLAIVWWSSVAITVVTSVDRSQFAEAGALAIMAAVSLAAVPGLVVLFAGYVAREGARRNAASSLILKAATQLLNPSRAYGEEAQTLASSLKASSEEIDQAMGAALAAMRSVSSEMGDERLRLESVTYAAADNARDLSARLADERAALETLARDLREQADLMGEAIPRQAAAMVDAARSASFDIAKSDEALEQRLQALKRTGSQINEEFAKIDTMAHTLQKQGDTLVFAVSSLETRLEEAQRTVEDTLRAGNVAGDVAGQTSESLRAAVDTALAQARTLNAEINESARKAGEDAQRAMADLRAAAEQAAASVREASEAARQSGALPNEQLGRVVEALNGAAGATRAQSATAAASGAGTVRGELPRVARRAALQPDPGAGARAADTAEALKDARTIPGRQASPYGRDGEAAPAASARETTGQMPERALSDRGLNGREAGHLGLKAGPGLEAEAGAVLPPPKGEDTGARKVVTLTSTRTAGFAQPNAHVAMPTELSRTDDAMPGQSDGGVGRAHSEPPAAKASASASGQSTEPDRLPPRASLGGVPVPVPPRRPAAEPQGRTPTVPGAVKAPRSVPRLDASPRELEAELFGGDEPGTDAGPSDSGPSDDRPTDQPAAQAPDLQAPEPSVDENIFHANPRDTDDPGLRGRQPLQPTAANARQRPAELQPRPEAPARALRQDGIDTRQAADAMRGRRHAEDPVGPPPPNVEVQPSLLPGGGLQAPERTPTRERAPAPARPPSQERAPSSSTSSAQSQPPSAQSGRDTPDRRRDADWSTILNDMDREQTGHLPREETAESVILRLETSGIALSNIFRPKAKKKIAQAARKGEQSRRAAIVAAARIEVDRVAKRLVADPELAQLAEDFVTMEEPDAIAALDRTQKSGRNASPRLSAFLLLDAATSSQRAAG